MGFGYVAYSRVDPPLPKPPLVPVASLGCANTAAFMKMHLGFRPARGRLLRHHSMAIGGPGCDCGVGPQDGTSSQPTRAGCPWRPRFVVLWRAEMLLGRNLTQKSQH